MKQKLKLMALPLLFLFFQKVSAQVDKVSGVVTDRNEVPLMGVNIIVEGAQRGTVTDFDGNYVLEVMPGDTHLIFSFLGYKTQTVPISSKNLNIKLEASFESLDELVLIGYGSTEKRDLTGSVASIKPEKINITPSGSFEQLIQGRVAGLQVINSSNDNPEGGATIRIRGNSSINGSNSPLVVVDGFPIGTAGNMNSVNPNNIASIEVLKDASASAIYGSRGANGVILITTKTGSGGDMQVFLNTKTSTSYFSEKLDYWRDTALMAELENEAFINQGLEPIYRGARDVMGTYYPSVDEIKDNLWPYYTDWSDQVFRNPLMLDYNLGINGSGEKTKYFLNLGYYQGQGMQVRDDYDKVSGDLDVIQQVTDKLSVHSRIGFVKGKRNINYGISYRRNPLFPVFNEEGTYYRMHNRDFGNVAALTNERVNKNETNTFYGQLSLDWQILDYLDLTARMSYRHQEAISSRYDPPLYTLNGDNHNGFASRGNSSSNNYVAESFLTYGQLFGEQHEVSIMGGVSFQREDNTSSYLEARGFTNQNLKEENLSGGETRIINNGFVETTLASGLGRINYEFMERYILTLTARLDGSSKFGENNKWAFFPSGAFAWKLHEEDFLKDNPAISLLKLRTSYGVSGNQGISPYQTIERYGSSFYYTDGREYITYGVGLPIGREGPGNRFLSWGGIANKSLGWESTSQFNAGVDISLFDSRLNITADYYHKNTVDLLRQQFLPLSTGFDRIWINDGEVMNRGLELSISGDIIDTPAIQFGGDLILSRNRNEVINIGSRESSGYIEDEYNNRFQYYGGSVFDQTAANIIAIGEPINVFYGYKVDGIIQDGPVESEFQQPGEFNYVDLNGDGVIDSNDRTIIGNPNPDFTGSLALTLAHESGFDLSLQLYGVYGNDIFSYSKLEAPRFRENRWTPENPINNRPSLRSGRQYRVSDWFIEDGSFLRLQNITLGYDLDKFGMKWLRGGRAYFTATNLFTLSGVSEYDPEVGEKGIGSVAFPRISTLTLGIDLNL
ncbi:MAG: TonB-dependent receptor [Algicola sp.]|nr:TonB-dependent receptor [Algicola sp.]